ncbi:flagellar hook-length control protein FliK [Myxococcota bacterium]|nr:flagellar hook-length control protein FliK [Myxococcota bacterium]
MSTVEGLLASVRESLVSATRALRVDDANFGSTLKIGQILKGRVLRHYDGSRYLVDFNGQEKVVESTLNLRVSENFRARVVSVGKQVHMQHLVSDAEIASDLESGSGQRSGLRPDARPLGDLFVQWNAQLVPSEANLLQQSAKRASNPELMGVSGLLLHKLGIRLTPELLEALYFRLDPAQSNRPVWEADSVPRLRLGATPLGERSGPVPERFADYLRERAADSTDDGSEEFVGDSTNDHAADDDSRDSDWKWQMGEALLNTQTHGRISHRVARIPIWLGEKFLEVSVALFSESERHAPDITFRRAVVFVELEDLGRIQITLGAADSSLRVDVAAESAASADVLVGYAPELKKTLSDQGFQVADLRYLQADLDAEGSVLESVVLHHISQDSLSRWI